MFQSSVRSGYGSGCRACGVGEARINIPPRRVHDCGTRCGGRFGSSPGIHFNTCMTYCPFLARLAEHLSHHCGNYREHAAISHMTAVTGCNSWAKHDNQGALNHFFASTYTMPRTPKHFFAPSTWARRSYTTARMHLLLISHHIL